MSDKAVKGAGSSNAAGINPDLIAGVEVRLEAYLGSARMTVAELTALSAGETVALDASLNRDVEIRLNGVAVARGELVSVDGKFGVRILEISK